MGEDNDLPACGSFLRKSLSHSLHVAMIEGGDGIVDDDCVVAAKLVQLRQKACERKRPLLALAQDIAGVGDPLAGIEVDLNDTLGILTAIGQIER